MVSPICLVLMLVLVLVPVLMFGLMLVLTASSTPAASPLMIVQRNMPAYEHNDPVSATNSRSAAGGCFAQRAPIPMI